MDLSLTCPKCKGRMELGFIVGRTGRGDRSVSIWSAGAPEASFWTGIKVKEPRKITTHRCGGCGYLESYAPKATEADV